MKKVKKPISGVMRFGASSSNPKHSATAKRGGGGYTMGVISNAGHRADIGRQQAPCLRSIATVARSMS
jgi:hypothetical protein